MKYEDAVDLHNALVNHAIVRVQTNGLVWWVEYAEKRTGRWRPVSLK